MKPAYFKQLNQELKAYKRAIPSLILDLDLLDQNIATLQQLLPDDKDFRVVVKSLPSIPLLDYLMEKLGTHRLMLFHQPFLSTILYHYGNRVDILLGKPMPIQTAEYIYKVGDINFENIALQWLVDTPERLDQYLQLAQKNNLKLRVNLELDVGLHRGGFASIEALHLVLNKISANKGQLTFSGFMGYDPHVAMLPKALRKPQRSFQLANDFYKKCVALVKNEFPDLWQEHLTFNGAGSPTLNFHTQQSSVLNELAAGSCLVKPSSFDKPSLSAFDPACFIATPVLKKMEGTTLPALEKLKGLLGFFKPAFKRSYFIYGGYWKAEYYYPPNTSVNSLFGPSTNQSMINTGSDIDLDVDDFIFLRPTQSEFVFLQFGNIILIRNGAIVGEWRVLSN